VSAMIESVYLAVTDIDDIQFLIKYAKRVFPAEPIEDCGHLVFQNIRALQADIAARKKVTRKQVDTPYCSCSCSSSSCSCSGLLPTLATFCQIQ
jgi:hypothetical protein